MRSSEIYWNHHIEHIIISIVTSSISHITLPHGYHIRLHAGSKIFIVSSICPMISHIYNFPWLLRCRIPALHPHKLTHLSPFLLCCAFSDLPPPNCTSLIPSQIFLIFLWQMFVEKCFTCISDALQDNIWFTINEMITSYWWLSFNSWLV